MKSTEFITEGLSEIMECLVGVERDFTRKKGEVMVYDVNNRINNVRYLQKIVVGRVLSVDVLSLSSRI